MDGGFFGFSTSHCLYWGNGFRPYDGGGGRDRVGGKHEHAQPGGDGHFQIPFGPLEFPCSREQKSRNPKLAQINPMSSRLAPCLCQLSCLLPRWSRLIPLISVAAATTAATLPSTSAENRFSSRVDDGWRFALEDQAEAKDLGFDDAGWRTLNLPHDWSIEGRPDPKAPMGGRGGFFPSGIGWYRLHLDAPAAWAGKKIWATFEGAYMNATVWCNGQQVASQPYGYISFIADLSTVLKPGTSNLLAVRVDNSQQINSRWYSGSGLYRHVWLTVADPVRVSPWGVFARTTALGQGKAAVAVTTRVENGRSETRRATVRTTLIGPDGVEAAESESRVDLGAGAGTDVEQALEVKNPALWSPEKPQMYRVQTSILDGDAAVDSLSSSFGIRLVEWSAPNGLTINGVTYKLNGGCIHHDNGVLGACAFDRAEERKIQLLKNAGFNAVRTSHNPPSAALLDACDRLGMLVMDEMFDAWNIAKMGKDYSLYFKEWWQRDLEATVRRDRNHPAIIMWSIGNEIPKIYEDGVAEYGPKLADAIRALDRTRPVTNAILGWPIGKGVSPTYTRANADLNWNSQDIVGANYGGFDNHIAEHAEHPKRVLVSTESNPPLGQWKQVRENAFCVGDFVWTAQDYLGEVGIGRWFYQDDATESVQTKDGKLKPLYGKDSNELYPWRGGSSGILDLIGAPKAVAELRQIAWGGGPEVAMAVRQPEEASRKVVVAGWGWHPTWKSWTWPGWEGKSMSVEVYSSRAKTRLYQDGRLVGEKEHGEEGFVSTYELPYRPGELRAVAVEDGREIGEVVLTTVGAPFALRLTPDRTAIDADGQDLSFVALEITDKEGRIDPNDARKVELTLEGPGTIAGLGNANLKSDDLFVGNSCRTYHGRALCVVRSTRHPGVIRITSRPEGLPSTTVEIITKTP